MLRVRSHRRGFRSSGFRLNVFALSSIFCPFVSFSGTKRLACILVLTQLAINNPRTFYMHLQQYNNVCVCWI
jgi:hypothetical protein